MSVTITVPRDAVALGLTRAEYAEVVATTAMPEEAWAYVPIITNGAGDRAQCVPRPKALQWALDNVTEAKAVMESLIAQHG